MWFNEFRRRRPNLRWCSNYYLFALKLENLGYLGLFIALIMGFIFAAFVALISGFLKVKFNTNEMITSYLLSIVTIHFCDYLITGPLKDPKTKSVSYKNN